MAGYDLNLRNDTDFDIRLIGVSVNPDSGFHVDAGRRATGSFRNLNTRGSRGLIVYDLRTEEVIALDTASISNRVRTVNVVVFRDSTGFKIGVTCE